MTFNDMVQEQRDKRIGKATSTDMRDAEIFGQIANLMSQVSVKNRKNLAMYLGTYGWGRASSYDSTVTVFESAKEIAESGGQWW